MAEEYRRGVRLKALLPSEVLVPKSREIVWNRKRCRGPRSGATKESKQEHQKEHRLKDCVEAERRRTENAETGSRTAADSKCVTRNWVGGGNTNISGTDQRNQTKLGNRRKDCVRELKPFRRTVKVENRASDGDLTFFAENLEVDRKVIPDRQ